MANDHTLKTSLMNLQFKFMNKLCNFNPIEHFIRCTDTNRSVYMCTGQCIRYTPIKTNAKHPIV